MGLRMPSHLYLFFKDFFLMWAVFKVFIACVIMMPLCYILAYWPQGTWDLNSPTRGRTHTSCPEGEVLTTGCQGSPKKAVSEGSDRNLLVYALGHSHGRGKRPPEPGEVS